MAYALNIMSDFHIGQLTINFYLINYNIYLCLLINVQS